MTALASGVAAVWAALETVRDPELDEPVTTLGFVASCRVADGTAEIRLRLPTYFCAPNFAFLMVADAHDAVSTVPGVRRVIVVLEDHFAAESINSGIAARSGFGRRSASKPAANWMSCALTFSARPCWPEPTGSAVDYYAPAYRSTRWRR